MLRGCSFVYAGKDSNDYDLQLFYVDNSTKRFTSGGGYEMLTTTLPPKAKTLLYGLDYSAEPLKFNIEILNPHGAITQNELMEIKDWLFGQDGWKKFYIDDDDFSGLHLNCLLIPKEDIVDSSGYRGLECEVVNDSPFWYAEDKVITYTKSDFNSLTNSGNSAGNIRDSHKSGSHNLSHLSLHEDVFSLNDSLNSNYSVYSVFNKTIKDKKKEHSLHLYLISYVDI